MARAKIPSSAFVREHLRYDPDTGEFSWVGIAQGRRKLPGFTHSDGYLVIIIGRQWYPAHRLAWLLMTDVWPVAPISHINGNTFDNRWSNLRLKTRKHAERLTQAALRSELFYEPKTGQFYRAHQREQSRPAGCLGGNGYIYVYVLGRGYLAHRLAWLWMTGRWPNGAVDHANRCRNDNRWSNLRDYTRRQNALNSGIMVTNTSGFTGVQKCRKRWKAVTSYRDPASGKPMSHHIGVFDTPEEAHEAYKAWLATHRSV